MDSTFWLTFGLHNPIYLFACVFPCTPTCLVYLLHLQICESFPTLLNLTFVRGKGVPSFDEMMVIALVEVDFDDPTTNVRGRRAIAIAKPTPRGY